MTKEIANKLTEEQLAMLDASYPVESTFNRIQLPRLGMVSQDVMEGKGKAMKVVTEAGTYFIEKQIEELDENGKKIWERKEIGNEIDATILYERKQLRFYDNSTESYTSSPIFDNEDQIVPLFCNKVEVARGTPAELKARPEFQGLTAKGKATSKLEEQRILYVLYEGEVYQMTVRGSSMYSFLNYKKATKPNTVITHMASEAKENGAISWSQMSFEVVRSITTKEFEVVIGHINEITNAVKMEKAFYNKKELPTNGSAADKSFKALDDGKM
jgi:hypothetical protein